MTTRRPRRRRPQYMPRELRAPWPGIIYPGEYGLQVRVVVNKRRWSRYYSYSTFGGDALAAHRAAAEWRLEKLRHRKFRLWGKGPRAVVRRRRPGGVREHAFAIHCKTPEGRYTQALFYIGTDNTKTEARKRRAHAAARRFWRQYRRWYEQGDVHPMELAD